MICIGMNEEKTWADVVNGRLGVVCGVVGDEGGGAKKLNFGGWKLIFLRGFYWRGIGCFG